MTENYNLANAVWQHSLLAPECVAIAHNGKTLTYEQFAAQAKNVAQRLSQSPNWQHRCHKTMKVGILAARGMHACVAIVGACWAGATYVPIGLKLPKEKIQAIFAACEFSAIIADAQGAKLLADNVLAASAGLIIRIDETLESAHLEFSQPNPCEQPVQVNKNDLAYVMFTSGTTGAPKGVMIEAGSVHNYINTMTHKLAIRATDRALETCDITFDVSVHNMFVTWQAGAALYVLAANLAMNAVKLARSEKLTIWNSVPSLIGMLQQLKALQAGCLPDLRLSVFGGEALPHSAATQWQEVAPNCTIFNLYGPTEATVFCLAKAFSPHAPITAGRGFVPIGTPISGCEARVVDATGQVVPDGIRGELALGGVQLARGYLGAPELTAQKFALYNAKRWYLTGDYALRDAAGDFHYLGRLDNQIKVLGHRVELEEIDAALRLVSGRDLVSSVAWPIVDGMAKGIVGFIAGPEVEQAKVLAALRQTLQPYMVPQRVMALQNMPLNASGKVDRKALTALLQAATDNVASV
jgi:D-alanine--poly(phosphoribitol) ligase subunit 1